jgi:hypothetical protein
LAEEDFIFPVYRKYVGNLSYFKIENRKKFTEIKIWGGRYSIIEFEARIYPDFILVEDMLHLREGRWVMSDAQEFAQVSQMCKEKFKEV